MSMSRRGPTFRQIIVSYAPDWIVTFALWWILYFVSSHVSGFKRHFSLADASLRYPYADNQRVGSSALWFLSATLPFGVQAAINLVFIRSWWDLHHSSLGLWLSITLTGSITQLVKVSVGRPRPNLISRCQPLAGSEDPLWGLSTVDICTQTVQHILEDGWRSFPSGHASLSFAGLGFLTFYLVGKLHLFDSRGYAGKVWLSLAPLGIAAWVAISRTMDYQHHWQDVLVGSSLGLGVAYFCYRQYYPRLNSKACDIPLNTRFEVAEDNLDLGAGLLEEDNINDDEENVGLIGGSRKPQNLAEHTR